jgi:hypothetical protein
LDLFLPPLLSFLLLALGKLLSVKYGTDVTSAGLGTWSLTQSFHPRPDINHPEHPVRILIVPLDPVKAE